MNLRLEARPHFPMSVLKVGFDGKAPFLVGIRRTHISLLLQGQLVQSDRTVEYTDCISADG